MKFSLPPWFLLSLSLLGCGKSSLYRASDFSFAAEFPSVAKILDPVSSASCTGIVLSEHTVLTAAHCIQREGNFVVVNGAGTTAAREIARLGDGTAEDRNDLVLLRAEDALALPSYPSIGRKAEAGEALSLVGFGCTDWDYPSGGGRMSKGRNLVSRVDDFIYLTIHFPSVRRLVGSPTESGLCLGDSGAPAFRASAPGELLGLGHSVYRDSSVQYSMFTDLSQPEPMAFLREQNSLEDLGIRFSRR